MINKVNLIMTLWDEYKKVLLLYSVALTTISHSTQACILFSYNCENCFQIIETTVNIIEITITFIVNKY